jgi:Uncharacterized protein conserved in bacteria
MLSYIKLANIASYDHEGISLSNLKKINFIYGANGCGKTTLSNYLYEPTNLNYSSCELRWDIQPLVSLVYNKKFRDKNFSESNIAGVFTLGQATTEQISKINEKRKELDELDADIKAKRQTLDTQKERLKESTDDFTEKCWSLYKKYEFDFKEAVKGSIGKKITFRDKIIEQSKIRNEIALELTTLKEKTALLLKQKPDYIQDHQLILNLILNQIELSDLWSQVVVGKTDIDIASLISTLNNSDWVNEGRSFVTETDVCPFCQQHTLTSEFKKNLELYFDNTFTSKKLEIQSLHDSYLYETNRIITDLESLYRNESQNTKSKLNCEKLLVEIQNLKLITNNNINLINKKINKSSQIVTLHTTSACVNEINSIITAANEEIKSHNAMVSLYDVEVINVKNDVWSFLVKEIKSDISSFESKSQGLTRGIAELERKIHDAKITSEAIRKDIIELNKNVTSIQPTIDEINRTLLAFGFNNFKLVESSSLTNHYMIQRENGDLAHNTLSEGEITFITFLYFMQLAKGSNDTNSISSNRILVIDDPISSLDSNILYVVSSLIKSLIRETKEGLSPIKQLIILTHNVYFHKEASFVNGRSNGDKDVNFWILRKIYNVSKITSYETKNPIESSYELLWREIKEWQNNSALSVQNIMRRIIENYFKILGKYQDDDLIEKFDKFEDKQICRSLLCWINDGSHTIPDDLFVQPDDDSIPRYLDIFSKIFFLTDNKGHYNMMMGIA